jgi:hypothetical protein
MAYTKSITPTPHSKSLKFNFLNLGEIFPVTATTNKVNEPTNNDGGFRPPPFSR